MNFSILKIGSLNINGNLLDKSSNKDFCELVQKYDIFCIQESWLTETQNLNVENYKLFRSDRVKKKKEIRGSGGVVILFKKHLEKGLSKIISKSTDILWMKFDKTFFNLDKDLYLGNCYIPQCNSEYTKLCDHYGILTEELVLNSTLGHVMLCGDFNSRTGNKSEKYVSNFIDCQHLNSDGTGIEVNSRDNAIVSNIFLDRISQDNVTNEYGRILLEMSSIADLCILNGRTVGDLHGKYTFHGHQGSSAIDYFLIDKELFGKVLSFKVWDQPWYTDHCPISLYMKCRIPTFTWDNKGTINDVIPIKNYIWERDSDQKLLAVLQSNEYVKLFDEFNCTNFDNVDEGTERLTSIITSAADKALKSRIYNKASGKTYKYTTFDPQCQDIKRNFRKCRRAFIQDPGCNDKRLAFIIARSKFRKKVKFLKNQQKELELNKLQKLERDDPKKFWQGVKKLIAKQKPEVPVFDSDKWLKHFNNLLNIQQSSNVNPFYDYIKNSLPVIESTNQTGPLDHNITEHDVIKNINSLRNGKSSGLDGISNEILKCGINFFVKPICKLFNTILDSGNFPTQWATSIIVPLFKGGNSSDVNNYRGIAVSSCISKVLTKIINTRIYNYCCEKDIFAINQSGFMDGRRTDDNIFTLNTIINSQIKHKKGKLFTAFVDFRKFFDCINRDMLFYKLQKIEITGKLYYVLKSIYSNCSYCIKMEKGVTKKFSSVTGVKQGCNLSPCLSNLFQNDLHSVFVNNCDPIILDNIKLNSLS